jgi:DHA2 family multidrug resistance protein
MVLFGSTVLIPQYVQVLLGYTAERAGMVISPAAFVMMFMMFVAGRTVGKMDPRLMVCIAYVITALGVFDLSQLDLTSSFGHIIELRILQVIALPFVFIPISTLNYVGVPATKTNQISSLSNFARNLGGSAGTALLTTFIARTAQVHQSALAANVVPGTTAYNLFTGRIKEILIKQGMSPALAGQTAIGEAYQIMLRQASMLSYKNAFTLLGCVVVLLSPLPFLMRLPPKRGARPGAPGQTAAKPAAEPAPEELAIH